MITHGVAPFLECSSHGDIRFSAYGAKINGRSIEFLYQSAKKFDKPLKNWRAAKGRAGCLNILEVQKYYSDLWGLYIAQNLHLLEVLFKASGLSDKFGQEGHCCQATELWRIRCECLGLIKPRSVDGVTINRLAHGGLIR